MCGIFGYIGEKDALEGCLKGLKQLEYRGYDSSGIAGVSNGKISFCKEIGKLSRLKEKIQLEPLQIAIGHTRWATHGKVTEINAHPHLDSKGDIAIVHNGIIENYEELKELYKLTCLSETDSEVIAQLIARHYQDDLVEAVRKTLTALKGHFAIAVLHKNHPDTIVAAARECPLSIGYDNLKTECIISSDPNAFLGKSLNVFFLKADEIACVQKGAIEVFDSQLKPLVKKTEKLDLHQTGISKDGHAHFMIKEIFEQPSTIHKAFLGRIVDGDVSFDEWPAHFETPERVRFIGCGTSAHAGMIGSLFLESLAEIPSSAEIASESRYRLIEPNTLIVAISQSGETADTLSAVREIRAKGFKVLGICNVKNSTLTREADACILLKAGPEISVCSTKAFTSQIAVLYLLALKLANKKAPSELLALPEQIKELLNQAGEIEKIAKKYSKYDNFFFMGRRYMYATAMESALKLKEISYVNANAYPGGELKHGPIALIDSEFPVIAFCANKQTEEKILSNLQEVKARGAPILALAPKHLKNVAKIADDVIRLPDTTDELSPFSSAVAGQLLAYYIALIKGCDIDQPRNLAKSVTVE